MRKIFFIGRRWLIPIILIELLIIFTIFDSVKAIETQIFYDDFESGAENWDLEHGWAIVSDNDNLVLQGIQHTFATAYAGGVVNKLELKLKLLQEGIHLNIRSNPTSEGMNRYFIGFYEGASYIQKQLVNNFKELKKGRGISLNEWHSIKIEIIQNRIDVFVDETLILSAQDEDILTEGGISFETFEDSQAYIDNVKVETYIPESKEIKMQDLFPN